MREAGEESEDKGDKEVYYRDAVDPDTGPAQAETRGQERLITPSFDEHARDRDYVGRKQSAGSERSNRIEGYSAADVDEGQEDGDGERDEDRVERNIPSGMDVGEESAARETMVTREGEELTGRCCYVVHATKDCHDHGDGSENSSAGIRLSSVVEDLNVRIAGLRANDALDIAKAEADCDEHEKSHDAVGDSGPDHGARKGVRSIAKLLRHVRSCVRAKEGEDGSQLADETG